ncbi:dihydrofolate reductase [Nocardia transvalensis]|uniref:Dihydrofolate reductase n=1 Tax=Nocardia transvalensis TaxID=37333 RepID=A0A7W9UNE1_9NOCA|nr:dihydrofolate reductase family protein [Nocardia transvalensis]MBB5918735.1 dihydrofolate reductase [Nocardia transvalensis]
MGSVTLWMQMSLDGFAEGPDQQVHWPVVDEELCGSYLDELRTYDLFLYGRRTFEIMASFWPYADADPAISPFYVDFARCWKATPKVVFSSTLRHADWNTRVVPGMLDEIAALKAQPGCDMVLFGGAQTASVFLENDLIDEYRLFVHPVVLGGGVPLFRSPLETADLQLIDVMTFDSAVVQMHYQQASAA